MAGRRRRLTWCGRQIDGSAPTANRTITYNLTSGNLAFPGLLTVAGSGAITLAIVGGSIGFNTNLGATAGNLTVQASSGAAVTLNVAENLAGVNVGSGTIMTLAANSTVGTVIGSGTVALGGNTLSVGGDNSSATFAGIINGSGGGF